ncbi:MAG TPA: DUF4270 family protein, partial [Bacteroidales bacterium]|nr:DUF4270 family protein [Bacteroidales bacterium]
MTRFFEPAGSVSATKRFFRKQSHNILALVVLLSVGLLSCEEDPANIGRDILPGSDFDSIVGIDTMSIEMYTIYSENETSMYPALSYIGSVNDPYFGQTTASYVTQLQLSLRWPADASKIDSAKLKITVTDVVGEADMPGVINIHEVDEKMYWDSSYTSTREVPLGMHLGSVQMPLLEESDVDTTLLLDLPVSMLEYILRDTTQLFRSSTEPDFMDYFNGLYFDYQQFDANQMVEVFGTTAVENIQDASPNTIIVYYTDTADVDKAFYFLMNEKCISYNRFLHDFEQADPDKMIKYINE